MFGGLGMEVIYVNCIYITSARSRHVAFLDAQELGKEGFRWAREGKRKAFPECCLYTMKDYPLETVALISHPGCPGNKELPSAPLSVLMPQHALRPPASGLTVLALSPLLRSCFFPSEGQAQTALADFSQFGALMGLQHTFNGFCKPRVFA